MRLNAKNNAETKLAEPVSESDTTIVVEDASVLPEVPYRLSIGDEIVEVTGADGNTLTVDRAVEGTKAFSHAEGVTVENRFTAGYYDEINDRLDSHEADKNNPHNVSKTQIGLSNVTNVKQASESSFDTHKNDETAHGIGDKAELKTTDK